MEDLTPLYNKEFYLAYLCGEDVVLPIPDGNAERYLAYLCGMDVTIPDVPDGCTETYLAYKCGEDVVLPDPLYRIEFYLAKWCGMDVEVPEPLYRIEYWLAQLANSGELKTVTGNPISVSDALAKPAESLTIEILPQQDLHGYANPWPAGGGKNKFKTTATTETVNGTTFTVNDDGTIRVSGTPSAIINGGYVFGEVTLPAGTYKVNGNSYPTNALRITVYNKTASTAIASFYSNYDIEFTLSSESVVAVYPFVHTDYDGSAITMKPMIRLASVTDATFAPFSNICPISGWTEAKVTRTGKNLLDTTAITQYSSWSASEYGGSYGSNNVNRTFTIPTTAGQTYTLTVKTTDHSSVPQYISFCKSNLSKDTTSIIDRFTTDSWQKDSYTFTAEADTYYYLRMGRTGTEANFATQVGKISYFQLELGSPATAYEPYTGTTYAIDWTDEAGTVYGGELDVTTGVLTAERVGENLGNLNWTYYSAQTRFRTDGLASVIKHAGSNSSPAGVNAICSCYKLVSYNGTSADNGAFGISTDGYLAIHNNAYSDADAFKTAMNGQILVYELATPLTIQLTPTEIQMLLGDNTIWNDVGDMVLEYLADGPADDIDALNILLNNRYVNNGAEDEATDKEALEILLGGNTR